MASGDEGERWFIGDPKNAADTLARIAYDLPPGFSESSEGRMTAIEEPRKEIAFFVVRTTQSDTAQALAELDVVLSSIVGDVTPVGDVVRQRFGDMPGMQLKATGTFEGKPVNVTLRFLEPQPRRYVVVAGVYLSARKEAVKDTFNAFFRSVRPAP